MKATHWAVLAAAVGLTAALIWQQWRASALEVAVVSPHRGPLEEFVEERGTTRLARLHHVTMPQAALVQPKLLEPGEPVKAGQLLAELDPRPLELEVAEATAAKQEQDALLSKSQDNTLELSVEQQAQSMVESVAATVEAAIERLQSGEERAAFSERIRDRLRSVSQAASKNEVEQAELAAVEAVSSAKQDQLIVAASRAIQAAVVLAPKMVRDFIERKKLDDQVTEARRLAADARLRQVKLQQSEASLRSPVDGVVLQAPVDTPRHLGFGEIVYVVGSLQDLEVETDVLSEDAVRIAKDDRCVLSGPALAQAPGGRLEGVVQRVSPHAFKKISSLGVEQQRVNIVIQLPPAAAEAARQAGLGVGYQLDVRVITSQRQDALQIPRAALFRDAEEQWQVFVVEQGRAQPRAVQVGIESATHAEILDGLSPEDQVISEPDARLVPGLRVRPLR